MDCTEQGGYIGQMENEAMFSNLKTVPIVLAADDNFAPVFAACLSSILKTSSPARTYDIVLLHAGMSEKHIEKLSGMTSGCENVSLRFVDVRTLHEVQHLKAGGHISRETYFRFMIPDAMPEYDKVLYLDCDITVLSDVAELYDTNITGYTLAAVRDAEFAGHLGGADKTIQRYINTELGMKDPENYFQAGVLLLNTAAMRKKHTCSEWMKLAEKWYRYHDQDILNVECEGEVLYLDMSWNVITDCDHTRISNVVSYARPQIQDEYRDARKAPKVVHYAGHVKPWQSEGEDMGGYFWDAIKNTPYSESTHSAMLEYQRQKAAQQEAEAASLKVKLKKAAAKIINAIFPKGSKINYFLRKVFKRD